ncbi:hypothetical protein L7F22_058716 [Adiantum nelumboides]|nr:hypothetical protein [Adiantum nelumboides]
MAADSSHLRGPAERARPRHPLWQHGEEKMGRQLRLHGLLRLRRRPHQLGHMGLQNVLRRKAPPMANPFYPMATLVYFQFVFAAITVILLAGSLLGRMNFIAWMLFVPLWLTFSYTIGAFSLWGGGFLFH